ncbi:MAG: hypothetical protein AB7O91_10850 [Sphingomonas sp.]
MPRPPVWYWIVAILALLWEAAGCYFYVVQVSMDAADLAALPARQAAAFGAMQGWQWALFAVAVWSGLAGAVGLVVRRRAIALWGLWLSLIAALVQYGYAFTTPEIQAMPAAEALPLPIAIGVIGLALVLFAGSAAGRGWLR